MPRVYTTTTVSTTSTKRPDELLVSIELPPTNGWRASYQKLRRRGAFDFPVLGVAAYIKDEGGVVIDARVVLGRDCSFAG